ncbi:MAG: hypothetical protein PVSMB9_03300 [Candidatus Dormibacteria bacterium]
MAQEISPVEVIVISSGRLVVKLSEEPDQRWRKLFADYMRQAEGFGASSKKSPFEGWDTSVPGPVINTGVDDFESNYRHVVRDAATHANAAMQRHEADIAGKASAEDAAKDRDQRELDREREKAKKIKFD